MKDVRVCLACDPFEHLSHLSMACAFLGVIETNCFLMHRECIQNHVQTATLMHTCVHATDSPWNMSLGTPCASLCSAVV